MNKTLMLALAAAVDRIPVERLEKQDYPDNPYRRKSLLKADRLRLMRAMRYVRKFAVRLNAHLRDEADSVAEAALEDDERLRYLFSEVPSHLRAEAVSRAAMVVFRTQLGSEEDQKDIADICNTQ